MSDFTNEERQRFVNEWYKAKEILDRARATYGDKNQILVAVEELLELAKALTKFGRYETTEKAVKATENSVIEELGDVYNVLHHVKQIYGISEDEIYAAAVLKAKRVGEWLSKSSSMEYTTVHRTVPKDINALIPLEEQEGTDE